MIIDTKVLNIKELTRIIQRVLSDIDTSGNLTDEMFVPKLSRFYPEGSIANTVNLFKKKTAKDSTDVMFKDSNDKSFVNFQSNNHGLTTVESPTS